ncbi:MAG: VPLPA-CTERM-specific exosortase XrtD [bacterium]
MEVTPPIWDKKKLLIGFFLITIAFFACYFSTLTGLMHIWLEEGDYSYALLIPFVTAYLLWEKKKKITATPLSTSWIGGLLFFLFLLASAYGILGSSPTAVRIALPFVILSIALFCTGRDMFKNLAFPLSLFFLMVPLPTTVQTMIGVPLKRISTVLGESILRFFAVPVFVEGNIIDLGVTRLQVADACSGLRYILPLLTIGILFAYFFEKNKFKQIFLVITTIPIAIGVNGIRIGLTGILAQRYGSKVAEGFFHGFSGWVIFMSAFVVLFIFHRIISVIFKKDVSKIQIPASKNENAENRTEPKGSLIPVVITSALLFSVAILSYTTAALPGLVIQNGFSSFPLSINEWQGRKDYLEPEMVALSGAEESFSATYWSKTREPVSLYIGYRGSPFGENENFFHSPNICLPSSGWTILSSTTHTISDVPQFGSVTVREMVAEKMNERCVVFFWFQTKSRTSYDVNINRWHLTLHALTRDNTHDLFFRLITPIGRNESAENAETRLDTFARESIAAVNQFLDAYQSENHDHPVHDHPVSD